MSSGQQHTGDWAQKEPKAKKNLFVDAERALHGMQDIVGRKWHPVVLHYLLTDGPLSFSTLKTSVDGISSKMLSTSLSNLEERGLVARDVVSEQPVRVEYTLTERGKSLEPLITEMVHWGSEHTEAQ